MAREKERWRWWRRRRWWRWRRDGICTSTSYTTRTSTVQIHSLSRFEDTKYHWDITNFSYLFTWIRSGELLGGDTTLLGIRLTQCASDCSRCHFQFGECAFCFGRARVDVDKFWTFAVFSVDNFARDVPSWRVKKTLTP